MDPNYANAVTTNHGGMATSLRSSKCNNSRLAGVGSNRSKKGAARWKRFEGIWRRCVGSVCIVFIRGVCRGRIRRYFDVPSRERRTRKICTSALRTAFDGTRRWGRI
jgi:hypothetical protein